MLCRRGGFMVQHLSISGTLER